MSTNNQHYVSFYAIKGENDNYHYTFKVHSKQAALKFLKSFKGIRAAFFLKKEYGRITLNERLQ